MPAAAALLGLYAPAGAPFRLGRWDAPSRQQLSLEQRVCVYMSDEAPLLEDRTVRLVERIEMRQWPFNTEWPNWRPDPSWAAPAIPHGWRPHGPTEVQ